MFFQRKENGNTMREKCMSFPWFYHYYGQKLGCLPVFCPLLTSLSIQLKSKNAKNFGMRAFLLLPLQRQKTKGDKNSLKPRIYKQQTINKKIKNKQL